MNQARPSRGETARPTLLLSAGPPEGREDLATLLHLVAAGRLHPEIGSVHDWSRTAATVTALRGRRIRGNAVLTVGRA